MKILILGGNAAGMSAAGRLLRRAPKTKVVVVEKSGEVSYGACGLPYYVGGLNQDLDLMRIRSAEAFRAQGIDLRLFHCVKEVDFSQREAVIQAADGCYREAFDQLLIATGSSAILPPLPGIALPGVYTLKTLADGAALQAALALEENRQVAIVGGGYIGLELAEACLRLHKQIRLFEAQERLLSGFDPEFSEAAAEELREHGVSLQLGEAIERIEAHNGQKTLHTPKGSYPADIVIFAIGVRPNTAFLAGSPLDMLRNGAIVTNAQMQTSVAGVYAAGDCATVMHRLLQKPAYLPLGTNANKQGRFAADAMLGRPYAGYRGALGTAMLRCVQLELAKTGLTESEARQAGIDAASVTVTAPSHAPYYTQPLPIPITIKLCFKRGDGQLLGAQLMGRGESAQRINVFACAIDGGMTTAQLGAADLGYAPPFSSVWDAIHIAANAAKP